MKRFWILSVIAISFVACTNNETKEAAIDEPITDLNMEVDSPQAEAVGSENSPVIALDESVYEFGEVTEGEVVKHIYTFTNTGNEPLIISNVSASCGCTTPDYSKHPINPGEKGSVSVAFDSQGQVGQQQKIITILSNAVPTRTVLQLKGEVKNKL